MKEVLSIKITEGVLCVAQAYVGEVRIIDRSQGSYVSDIGYELLNYDKMFTIAVDDLDDLIDRISDRTAEILCTQE